MDSSILRNTVISRLLAVGQHLRQREQHRLKLTSYSAADYKPGAAGAEMVQLLGAMSTEENLALTELVLLRDDIAAYCRAAGKGDNDLNVVDEFNAFRSARTLISGCPGSKHFYTFVSRVGGGPAGRDSIHDVRFHIELETGLCQVLEHVKAAFQNNSADSLYNTFSPFRAGFGREVELWTFTNANAPTANRVRITPTA
jgi:hypothetical protein